MKKDYYIFAVMVEDTDFPEHGSDIIRFFDTEEVAVDYANQCNENRVVNRFNYYPRSYKVLTAKPE